MLLRHQDKVWVTAPDGERWEGLHGAVDSETFFGTGSGTIQSEPVAAQGGCCGLMTDTTQDETHVAARLSTLGRLLPVWIGAAGGTGVAARPADPRTGQRHQRGAG